MNKKFYAFMLALLICINGFAGASMVYAADGSVNQSQSYVYERDDEIIEYYLDENNMPYVIREGSKMPVALPLEHLKVTEAETLAQLSAKMLNSGTRAFTPNAYYDMTNGGTYTETMYLTDSYQNTSYIRINQSHPVIRIRTENEVKNTIFTGKKISYVVYYYCEGLDSWYSYTVNDCNVSTAVGGALDIGRAIYSYVYYGVKKSSDLYSADVCIWQTDV